MLLKFNAKYFALTMLIFFTEVLIALFVHDRFVRPYIGDVLVVVLIYCFLMTFLHWPYMQVAIFVLLFAFAVEVLQYFKLVEILGLQNSKLARIVIGTAFAWIDFVAYFAGFCVILVAEKATRRGAQKREGW